ncbi:transcription factor MYB77-like [Oryza brachyantha]|uniref:transcription factor MYB77-like n=1 Tax=Oryza brachyantha TaxID=4533 RepID=UPI001AD9ACEC|nr:transcription factor MYB77-like [Oryza brachyantha]
MAAGGGGRKTPWTEEEDEVLRRGVREHRRQNWAEIALALPRRGPKSCRLRWCQHLSPELDSRAFTPEEDALIVEQQRVHGNKWATIARCLTGRSDNAVKNRWNSTLRKLRPAAAEKAVAAAHDDAPVCLELFPARAGGVKEAAVSTVAAGRFSREKDEEDVATGLTLGLPVLSEEAEELELRLRPSWPATM